MTRRRGADLDIETCRAASYSANCDSRNACTARAAASRPVDLLGLAAAGFKGPQRDRGPQLPGSGSEYTGSAPRVPCVGGRLYEPMVKNGVRPSPDNRPSSNGRELRQ